MSLSIILSCDFLKLDYYEIEYAEWQTVFVFYYITNDISVSMYVKTLCSIIKNYFCFFTIKDQNGYSYDQPL